MKDRKKDRRITLLGFILEKRKLLAVFLPATAALAVAAPVKSYIMQWLIDAPSKAAAIRYLAVGMGVILVSHATEYVSRISFAKMACRSVEQARDRLMEVQARKPLREYLSGSTGDVLSCLTNDMRLIYDEYYMSIFNILMWGGMMVALIMLAFISPALLLIALVLGMAPLLVPQVLARKMGRARDEFSRNMAAYTAGAGELLKGFEALVASDASGYLVRAHAAAAEGNRKKEYRMQFVLHVSAVASSLVAWIPSITVLLFGVFLVYDGRITIGYLVTANMLTNFVITPCRTVADAYAKLKASVGIQRRIDEAMNPPMETEPGTKTVGSVECVALENVEFSYPGAEEPALKGVSLSVRGHEKAALVGLSGSGKSTVAKILFRYFDTYQGKVLVDGLDLKEITRESYYRHVALIPQTPFLFSDSIYNNLCLYGDFTEEEVKRAVELAGLWEFVAEQPEGLHTLLAENGRNLSGGQAQRIAVARAVLRKCDILLVDEATSSLDAATTAQVMENLLGLDCAVVIITHDIFGDYMRRFDRIYYLEHGEVKESGTFDGLLEAGGRFSRLYANGRDNGH